MLYMHDLNKGFRGYYIYTDWNDPEAKLNVYFSHAAVLTGDYEQEDLCESRSVRQRGDFSGTVFKTRAMFTLLELQR